MYIVTTYTVKCTLQLLIFRCTYVTRERIDRACGSGSDRAAIQRVGLITLLLAATTATLLHTYNMMSWMNVMFSKLLVILEQTHLTMYTSTCI